METTHPVKSEAAAQWDACYSGQREKKPAYPLLTNSAEEKTKKAAEKVSVPSLICLEENKTKKLLVVHFYSSVVRRWAEVVNLLPHETQKLAVCWHFGRC